MEEIKKIKSDLAKLDKEEKIPAGLLPEYKIQTMKDDLAQLSLKAKLPPSPPEELPIAPSKAPLPTTEELITKKPAELPKPPQPEVSLPWPEKPIKPEVAKPKKKKSKLLIILIIIFLILIGVGGFLYWQGREKPLPPLPPVEEEEPEPSESLIPADETKIASISSELNLLNLLKQEAKLDQSIKTLKRIAVLKNKKEFLSLTEIFQNLEIGIPPYTLAELKQNYTLVLDNQDGKRHLGIVVEIENADNLKEQLRFWEKTMVDDLENFFLGEPREEPATSEFQDNIYKEIPIRYINFPEPDLTIDYAIIEDVFILTTSRESIYKIIDRIK